jgi:hypothetical protein
MRKTLALLVVAAAIAAACIQVPTDYRLMVCVQSGDSISSPNAHCAVVDTIHP